MYVVYDLETTGLSELYDDIVQFAYAAFDDNSMLVKAETLYFYYKGMRWNQEVADKTHKLSLDFLKTHEDKFRENIVKMWTILSGNVVVGHNNRNFDDIFASQWLARHKMPGLTFQASYDTMADLRSWHKRSRIKLTAFGDMIGFTPQMVRDTAKIWFGVQDANAHNAAYDVVLTALITNSALRRGYFNFTNLNISTDTTVDECDDLFEEAAISVDMLCKYHSVYCKLLHEDGTLTYLNTTNDPIAWPSVECAEQPKFKIVPHVFSKRFGEWCAEDTDNKITYNLKWDAPNYAHLEIVTPYGKYDTKTMPVTHLA